MSDFVTELDQQIRDRKKMTSPLYQTILAGKATQRLLQAFVAQRWPIKSFWTRNILGIASQVDDARLRVLLLENIYEEETGRLSGSRRHLATFGDFGRAVGLRIESLDSTPHFAETDAVIAHNRDVCNNARVHFTAGVASVLLLMEGQPPIVTPDGRSMLSVMRDDYDLPEWGFEFFTHHASAEADDEGASDLEEEHAAAARELITRYCRTNELQALARTSLARALDLRHRHFDAILHQAYDSHEPVFRYCESV
jgi:pyrroloquinoline-quinone synthase